MNAIDMMMSSVMKNIPPETLAQVTQIGQVILTFKSQLDRIERNQGVIMRHLKIPMDGEIMEKKNEG